VQGKGTVAEQQSTGRVYYIGGNALEEVEKFRYLGGYDTSDAKMTKEVAIRIQRMKGAYAKYDRQIFRSGLSDKRKAALFNMIVVMNGLFGCQVWNVTQLQVDKLEAVNFSLMRKMLALNKREYNRSAVIQYSMDRELNLFPLEWKMMKLQLRYFGHEVRVKPDRVRRLPHNMLFRGHVDGKSRVRGRGEQAYPATIRRALERCGLEQTQWVQLALDRKEWKDFIEKRAMIAFMQGWEEKEEVQKEQRQRDELVRADRESTRTRLITDGREDDHQHEQFGDHRIEGDSTEVMTEEGDDGAESEEYVGMSDSEDEGEEEHREVWGGHRRVQMGDIQVGQRKISAFRTTKMGE
jgi:hypothetical protein